METFGKKKKKKDFYFVFRVKVEIMSVNLTLEDSNRLRGICSPITHSKRMLSLLPGEQQPWNSNAKCQACAAAIRKMKVRSNRAERGLRLSSQCHLTTPVYSNTERPVRLHWAVGSIQTLHLSNCRHHVERHWVNFLQKKIWPWLTFSFF